MKKYKKLIVAGALTVGIGAGAVIFTPSGMNASSNVVLASVDWVNSKLNPVNSKISTLESKLNSQQATITKLQQEINKLKGSNDSVATPSNSGTPSIVYVSKSSIKVHSGATRSYKVVATKSKGTSLKVIDSFKSSSGVWYRVSLSTTLKGWVYSGDVSTKKTSQPTKVVIKENVNLRKGATTGYPSVQLLSKGTTLKYISSFKNNKGETWYNVETSSGKRGWIKSTYGEVK
jgi:uncharacterized protein YgiM (DUF1202 family)